MTWTICTSTTPVARKSHLCRQCRTAIEIGTRHECASGIYDGKSETVREHLECARAVRSLIRLRGEREDDYEDAWPVFADEDMEDGEIDWLRERHQVVASRLGMEVPS